jgi:capsular exopolysaccharide synthesis family protein
MEENRDQTSLSDALKVLRRRAGLILVCFILVAGSALVLSLIQTKQYSAEASLLFRDPGFDQRLFGVPVLQSSDPARDAATNARLVALDVVAERTAQDMDHGLTGATVSEKLQIDAQDQSDVATITATDPDPALAAELANAFARNYVEFRRAADRAKIADARRLVERDYERLDSAEQNSREGQALQKQISELKTLEALQTGNAEVVQKADVPTSPSSPQPRRDAMLGGILGLLLGVAFAFVVERLDRRLRDPIDLERAFGLPILGTVPDSEAFEGSEHATTLPALEAEAFRMVRTRLRYFNVDRDIRSIVVTSAVPGEGKSTIARNLACTGASAGSRTILVEADFHRPNVAAALHLNPLPGLAEVLTHQVPLEQGIQHAAVDNRRNGAAEDARQLDVLVAGATPPNAAELIESEEMRKLLARLSGEYELVVFDTPPATVLADAIPLMNLASGVIVVGQLNRTTRDEAMHLAEQLRSLDAPVLGVVANRGRKGREYGYYYQADDETVRPRVGRRS